MAFTENIVSGRRRIFTPEEDIHLNIKPVPAKLSKEMKERTDSDLSLNNLRTRTEACKISNISS